MIVHHWQHKGSTKGEAFQYIGTLPTQPQMVRWAHETNHAAYSQ